MPRISPLLIAAFLISCLQMSAQETTISITDVNEDGFPDSLLVQRSSTRSAYGFGEVTLVDGQTQGRFTITLHQPPSAFLNIVEVPDKLFEVAQQQTLATMAEKILPPPAITPDPSLWWILNGLRAQQQPEDHPYFDLIIDPQPKWLSTTFYLPQSYYLRFGEGTYAGKVPLGASAPKQGLLVYSGHNHNFYTDQGKPTNKLEPLPGYEQSLFKSRHGLVQKNEAGAHRWIFVSEYALTGAPEKLRWSSIGEVHVWQKLLILRHLVPVAGGENIYLIDLETGKTARLRGRSFSGEDDRISIKLEGDMLLLKGILMGDSDDGGPYKSFSLPKLWEALQHI
ncbi:MAG: hypothetical protein AAF840_00565 [Bacteroidota bacterium]